MNTTTSSAYTAALSALRAFAQEVLALAPSASAVRFRRDVDGDEERSFPVPVMDLVGAFDIEADFPEIPAAAVWAAIPEVGYEEVLRAA